MSILIKGVTKIELMKALIQSTYFLPDDIEIIELPASHGRLIDADALADDLEHDAKRCNDSADFDFYFNVIEWLRSNQNKVLIEAEKEE